jgi:hypothetical protein
MNQGFGLFADEVFSAADLGRRSREVLDRARENPVTISRNSERFALLRRDQAARLVRASIQFGPTIEFVSAAISVIENKEPPDSLLWLKAFDTDDIRKLVREVLVASDSALRETGDWGPVDAIIHEWHESALVSMSSVLKDAMESPPDEEVELPDPRTIPQAESDVVPEVR